MRPLPSPFALKVVGVSFVDAYPDNLWALSRTQLEAETTGEPLAAVLVRNPDNPHDSNAIEVHVPALGERWAMIGHINAVNAARMAPEIDAGAVWAAEVESVNIVEAHIDRPGIAIRCRRIEADDE